MVVRESKNAADKRHETIFFINNFLSLCIFFLLLPPIRITGTSTVFILYQIDRFVNTAFTKKCIGIAVK